jgi:putative nucleotidyltransferase with HDIG domain
VDAAVLRALEKKTHARFADMLAFRCALEGRSSCEPSPNDPAHRPTEPPNELAVDAGGQRRVGGRLAQILVERIHKDKLVLPAMPASARECLRLLDAPDNSLDKVIKVIAQDPIIAPQVMRRARSALMGGRANAVRTLDQAVSRLGVRTLRELIMNVSARQLFESKNAAIRKLTKDLWQHSVAVGILARALTRRRKDVDPELAYLAGLLHDVGKPVAAALLLELERTVDSPQNSWLSSDAWLGVIHECHREVGVALARSWHMDEEVLLAIARCDRYSADNPASVSNAVCYANALAKRSGMAAGEVDSVVNDALLREGETLFKLDASMVETLVTELRTQQSSQ